MSFHEMIERLYKTHEFSRNFAQREMLKTCIAFAEQSYEVFSE